MADDLPACDRRTPGTASGAVALSTQKGGNLHRQSGTVFVYAMLVMSTSGAMMAALIGERISVMAGMLTFYLVITSLLTVRHRSQASRWIDVVATMLSIVFALIVGLLSFAFALIGDTGGTGPIGFLFGVVAVLAAVGDLRMLITQRMEWPHRIARHLWRMCFALWIAAASFFLGQSDEFPEALRIMPLLCTPVLLVIVLMVFWLVRVLFTKWRPRAEL